MIEQTMNIDVDGFSFQFTGALDVVRFDEQDKTRAHFHGLSHAMKAVDLVVELRQAHFNHLRDVLKHKFRNTWLYRWAEGKTDKPIDRPRSTAGIAPKISPTTPATLQAKTSVFVQCSQGGFLFLHRHEAN